MSLILDALRKSEAERRRGQSPDLFAATPGAPAAAAPRPRVWPLLLLGAMLLASAWMIWSADAAPAPPVPTASGELSTDLDRTPALPAPVATTAIPARDVPAGRTANGLAGATARATPPDPPVPPAPRTAPTGAALPAPPEPVAAAEPDLPPLAVLDASARAALPPLKLSMHVYADEPGRRFAIIDGERVAEGARLGAGVVARIRRDGVVLEVDGRQYLLPKP